MEVFHFSEDPNIRVFVPRPVPARAPSLPGSPSPVSGHEMVVWAIDEWHSPLYYFPRDCPRIMVWRLPTTTEDDVARWLGGSTATRVACIEWGWLDRLRAAALYRYTFSAESFVFLDAVRASPGTWLSYDAVEPVSVTLVGDLLAALSDADVELRLMPSLTPWRGVWGSTLHASGVRLRNAKDWPRE